MFKALSLCYFLMLGNRMLFSKTGFFKLLLLVLAAVALVNIVSAQTVIRDWHDLDDVRNDLSGNYELANDLDQNTAGYSSVASNSANSGNGFKPIATSGTDFKGTFDGNGHTIHDLHINRSSSVDIGLFGGVSTSSGTAIVENFALKNVDISGDQEVGAVVGSLGINGEIHQVYANGTISANDNAGGLVGQNTGTIKNAYSKADVTGSNGQIGGLVGFNNGGTITNCYATGQVSGNSFVGGLVGQNTGFVNDGFWDTQTSNQSSSLGGTGKTTTDMQKLSTFNSAWNIADQPNWTGQIWIIDNTNTYPRLGWERQYRTTSSISQWSDQQWELYDLTTNNWNSTSQTPSGSETILIKHNVTIKSAVSIDGTLQLNGGVITVNSSSGGSLTIEDGGSTGQGSSNSYVNGSMKKKGDEAFTFPLGNGGQWARLRISGSGNSGDAYTVSYTNSGSSKSGTGSNLHSVSAVEHWELSYNNNVASPSRDVTLYWEDASFSGISNLNDLVIAHWNTSNTEWESLGQSTISGSTSSNGSITVNGVSNFSPFTFGSTSNNNSLPVELTHFTVQQEGRRSAVLEWATASETNNKHFLVQRRRGDQWQQVGKVEGHGTTTVPRDYRFIDNGLIPGTHYYRLKQVDFDGSYEYSDVKALTTNDERGAEITMAPNPVQDNLSVAIGSRLDGGSAQLVIHNAYGQQVYQGEIGLTEGKGQKVLSLSHLKPGVYMLRLRSGDETIQKRLIKQD
jgi:hypothetical protein